MEKVYVSIIASMVAGRIVWGSVQLVLLGIGGNPFTWEAFWAGAVLKAIPGIVMLLIVGIQNQLGHLVVVEIDQSASGICLAVERA